MEGMRLKIKLFASKQSRLGRVIADNVRAYFLGRIVRKLISDFRFIVACPGVFFFAPGLARLRGNALLARGEFDKADAIYEKALLKSPGDFDLLVDYASIAEKRGDLDQLLARARLMVERFPLFGLSYAFHAGALRKAKLFSESQAVVDRAIQEFPQVPELAVEQATLAQDTNDLAKAIEFWGIFVERFPDRAEGAIGLASALRSTLEFEAADKVLLNAQARFSREILILTHLATNADMRGDRPDALQRWERVVDLFPDAAIGYAGKAAALKALGRFEEADAILFRAMERFPSDVNLGINYAWVAEAQGNWKVAEERWRILLTHFPLNSVVRSGLSECSMKASLVALDSADTHVPTAPHGVGKSAASTAQMQPRELLLQFESIGENCELGFVQRHFEAEPLGLIRWAGISLEQLIRGLDTDFEGVGEPEFTTIAVNPHNHEYYTEDTRFWLSMHSFILRDDAQKDKIYRNLCRRLRFLKERLLEDLGNADKVFVFQTRCIVTENDVQRLYRAVRRHGPNTLLVVQPGGSDHCAGMVEFPAENLHLGYLSKVGYDGKLWDIRFDEWYQICRKSFDHRLARTLPDRTDR